MRTLRVACVGLALLPAVAWGHHFMGAELPRTLMQGFLSGLGHPIIGLDHAAFIVATGFVLALARHGLWGIPAMIAGTLIGAALHLAGIDLAGAEVGIAVSVVLVGALVMARRALPLGWLAGGIAVAGVLHGHAYAESIFGAEPTPLAAYLAGFSVIQLAIAMAAFFLHRRFKESHRLSYAVGGTVAAIGLLLQI
jgi:urease accessory protein